MNNQTAIIKLLPSLEIAGCINELLRELQSRGDHILDYENCDMSLDHVEYHKAEDIDGEKFGDGSDNLYCFLRRYRNEYLPEDDGSYERCYISFQS